MARWASEHEIDSDESLGPLLIRVRRRLGRSQLRLAEQLCAASGMATVSRHEISRWEREERIPSPFWLAWLGEVLGITDAQLERAIAGTRRRRAVTGRRSTVKAPWPDGLTMPWRVIEMRCAPEGSGAIGLQIVRPVPVALDSELA